MPTSPKTPEQWVEYLTFPVPTTEEAMEKVRPLLNQMRELNAAIIRQAMSQAANEAYEKAAVHCEKVRNNAMASYQTTGNAKAKVIYAGQARDMELAALAIRALAQQPKGSGE